MLADHDDKRAPGTSNMLTSSGLEELHVPTRRSPRLAVPARYNLRILLPVLNFGEEETGVGRYTFEMARFFADCGHEVHVLCAPPYYPWWEIQKPYSRWMPQRETLERIKVFRVPLYVPKRPNGIRRLAHLGSMAVSSFLPSLMTPGGIDLVWIVQPSLVMAPAAFLAAARSNAPTWMHVQDLEVAAADRLKVVPETVVGGIKKFESFLYKRCQSVSTISSTMRSKLRDRCEHDIPVFPNWVDLHRITPMQAPSPYREELGIPDGTVVALYSGNMGEKQGLDIIVEAARQLRERPDLLFVMAGQGAVRPKLEQMAEGLTNMRFLPLQPSERMNDFLALGDIHLVPQKAGVGDLVMPSKMTGILSSGRPVVATCEPGDELGLVVEHCGLATPPGDTPAFAQAIVDLLDNPERRREWGLAGRIYAERNLSDCAILPKMERHLWKVSGVRELGRKR
jgi:colanic acid biosynthesis glycosyl transferase WcaI